MYFQIIDLSDIELDSPQAENKDDYEYIPSADGECETPIRSIKRKQKKSSLAATQTKRTSKSSLFVSTVQLYH